LIANSFEDNKNGSEQRFGTSVVDDGDESLNTIDDPFAFESTASR